MKGDLDKHEVCRVGGGWGEEQSKTRTWVNKETQGRYKRQNQCIVARTHKQKHNFQSCGFFPTDMPEKQLIQSLKHGAYDKQLDCGNFMRRVGTMKFPLFGALNLSTLRSDRIKNWTAKIVPDIKNSNDNAVAAAHDDNDE